MYICICIINHDKTITFQIKPVSISLFHLFFCFSIVFCFFNIIPSFQIILLAVLSKLNNMS